METPLHLYYIKKEMREVVRSKSRAFRKIIL